MAGMTDGELAALADDELPADRRAVVEAAVAASPELARRLTVQVRTASAIRAAAERVKAPARLRAALAAGRRDGGNPSGSCRP
jgi:anti-sigma factor RsiW